MKVEHTGGKFSGSAQGFFLSKGVIKTERWGSNFSQINCYNTGNHSLGKECIRTYTPPGVIYWAKIEESNLLN